MPISIAEYQKGKDYPSLDNDIIDLLAHNRGQAFNLIEIETILQSTYKQKYGTPIFDSTCVLIALDRVIRKGVRIGRWDSVQARVVETKHGLMVYYRIVSEPAARPPER